MNRTQTCTLLGLFCWLLTPMTASADLVVDVVAVSLFENTPNQTIPINVTGPDAVQGLNLNIQVADGGPEAGGSIDGPAITAVDTIGPGTIFNGNNTGQVGGLIVPQIAGVTTSTSMGSVPAGGTLAFVTFDTTGFFTSDGPFNLLLTGTRNGDTDFANPLISGTSNPGQFTIANGSISLTAVPKPSAFLFLALVGAGCAGIRWHRHRTRPLN